MPEQLKHELSLCHRELRAIYDLDALRDTTDSTETFLTGCAAIIRGVLQPDLLQLITLDLEDCPAQNITIERWRPNDAASLMLALTNALAGGETSALQEGDSEIIVRSLSVKGERLGVLVLGSADHHWSADDRRLMDAMCSQIDSAMAGLRLFQQVQSRNRELETIYRLDRLIDATPDFEQGLGAALGLLSETIGAAWSFIMLYTAEEHELEFRAASHADVADPCTEVSQVLRNLARQTVDQGKLVRREQIDQTIGAYIGVPLILKNQIIGVFGGANPPGTRGFSIHEVKMLNAIASQMDTALFEDRQQRHIRETFARYVSPDVVDLMLRTPGNDYLNVHRQQLSMLFSDMRGFTTVSEQLPADVVARMLNEHLSAMTTIIRNAGGTVDKFVGDEIVAFFGAPLPYEQHPLLAVQTGLLMQARHTELMLEWQNQGLPAVAIGIGIASGEVVVGNIGSSQMMNYTAIGSDMNLAARLCSAALPNQILVSQATYDAVREEVQAVPVAPLSLRHISQLVQAYSIEAVRSLTP
ncbi:adenylate/guanylate cyclase domain-containing protein [Herpetosiphon gulosus]|uniref:Guanylate cyclase domain-containing protein n=1 Tax=Herpetosiphon gulosus TaxID=1973496 RepID=A0ABP9WV49_9CHLR